MFLLPHSEKLLHVAGAASFVPILLAIAIVSLPVVLPLAIYRWVHGVAPTADE